MMDISIASQRIGAGHPVYIVAEIGINHNGSLKHAEDLIRVVREHLESVIRGYRDFDAYINIPEDVE